jgi:hypothetical protein
MVDLTTAQVGARDVTTPINHNRAPRPAFARDNQNMATAAMLLDTLPAPSTDEVDRVYHQLKHIFSITAAQQAESSLQRWAEVSISNPGRSKAGRQKATMKHPVAGTTSSRAQILVHD